MYKRGGIRGREGGPKDTFIHCLVGGKNGGRRKQTVEPRNGTSFIPSSLAANAPKIKFCGKGPQIPDSVIAEVTGDGELGSRPVRKRESEGEKLYSFSELKA